MPCHFANKICRCANTKSSGWCLLLKIIESYFLSTRLILNTHVPRFLFRIVINISVWFPSKLFGLYLIFWLPSLNGRRSKFYHFSSVIACTIFKNFPIIHCNSFAANNFFCLSTASIFLVTKNVHLTRVLSSCHLFSSIVSFRD